MRKLAILLTLALFMLGGCSNEKNDSDEVPALLEVTVNVPNVTQVNENMVIEAEVTQGEEKVEDANEVKFEIKKVGHETSEEVIGKNQGNGIYSITKSFPEAGDYSVTAHVTARSMHNMPTKNFKVE